MNEFVVSSTFFGVVLSLIAYEIGVLLKKKFKVALFNPILIAIVLTLCVLLVCKIDYNSYNASAKYLGYLLTPATVSLALPLYEQIEILKKNAFAIFTSIFIGALTSLCCILGMAIVFGLSHAEYVTFLPKSITTAIGMGVSEELGGYVSITVAVIIITGVIGNVIAETVFKLFRIKHPIAKGVALGTSSHAIGTAKAMELGELEGAMSSLSIVVCGIITVVGATIFSVLL